jgi:bifunctional DNase/RNase
VVPVEFRGIARDPRDGAAVIILAGDDDAALPVWVDDESAEQVERAAARTHMDPPDDGAAFAALLRSVGGSLRAARLRRGGAGVVAELLVAATSEDRVVEARASLAISAALWCGARILVEEALVEEVRAVTARARDELGDEEPDAAARWNAWLEHAVRRDET